MIVETGSPLCSKAGGNYLYEIQNRVHLVVILGMDYNVWYGKVWRGTVSDELTELKDNVFEYVRGYFGWAPIV